ncbi:Hypothetical predicted protein [Olea europaea subsp. europaea]|uniref:C2 domain-containing protein n=1 Tax=Olea europaea subsp. europaea TaxID=158383 RepID=A0A8S0T1G9_OLEEU|nr:Hypothetical predicted protein [Olea europaea subsp. europaea]
MRTYAVTWVHPGRKFTTRTDKHGQTNPTWNDKFAFRVDDVFLLSDNAAVNVEIYNVSWLHDVLVGIVHVPVGDLINPSPSSLSSSKTTRFVALQVRRPSGNPQGILNMGVSLLDSSMKSMPFNSKVNSGVEDSHSPDGIRKEMNNPNDLQQKNGDHDEEDSDINEKIQFWRSMAEGSENKNEEFPIKPSSVCNGSLVNESACKISMVNGSDLCSDIGPSASVVAAELAQQYEPPQQAAPPSKPKKKPYKTTEIQDTESSILEELTFEEAAAKGFKFTSSRERWRNEGSKRYEYKPRSAVCGGHSRRKSDGGLFSCFGNAYGIEFTIVCGAGNDSNRSSSSSKKLNTTKSRKKRSNKANSV